MKLIFRGHDDRYAIEQSLLAFFPEERPVYETAEAGEDDCAYVSLTEGKRYATGVTSIHYHGKTARGVSRAVLTDAPDEYERERLRQRALKLSFFKAARDITGVTPSWGALTGIRPGKLARAMLEQGKTERETDRVLRDTYFVSPERRRLAIETARAGLKAKRDLRPDEISLYVGIPFCPTRCAYCSFVSASVEKSFGLMEPYLASLEQEITDAARMVAETGLRIKSFYMGGGTPTTLSARQMDHLLTHLNRSFDLTDCAEYCIEAGRPDTITREKLQVLLDHGADRISVNPQTLSDRVLDTIGRRHTAQDIYDALRLVRETGGFAVNMDLIAGLPGDTPDGFRATLEQVLALAPENITVHTLSRKRGSNLMAQDAPIPDGAAVGEMLDFANTALPKAGYAPYYLYRQKFMSGGFENVGWTRPGQENLYNICIMEELCSILAMGGGASTKLVRPNGGRLERHIDPKYPTEYIANIDRICAAKAELEAFFQ